MELENTATEEVVEDVTDQEVAEPDSSQEDGSKDQEVAQPDSEEAQSHEDNHKFQAMRHEIEEAQRKAEEAERKLAEYESMQQARESVYNEYLEDEDLESALADVFGTSSEEVKARIEERAELNRLRAENEQFKALKEEAEQRAEVARQNEALTNQLAEVQEFDPSIKNVLDFENKFAGLSHTPTEYLEKGLTLAQTYWALKAEQDAHKRTPPPEVGGVKSEEPEKPFYTKEDVMAMTPSERAKHWKEIRAAQTSGKW